MLDTLLLQLINSEKSKLLTSNRTVDTHELSYLVQNTMVVTVKLYNPHAYDETFTIHNLTTLLTKKYVTILTVHLEPYHR
jgi:hypothetical protein